MAEPITLCQAFQRTAALEPDAPALREFGTTRSLSWKQYAEQVRAVAGRLAALGVARGDTVGFMLSNRPEFHVFDAAAMHLGATCYSIYNTSAPEQIAYVVNHAASRVLVTETQFADTLRAAVPTVEHVVCVDTEDDAGIEPPDGFDFDAAWQAVQPDDVVTLIYTSGTTGPPKGVELTHLNVATFAAAIADEAGFRHGDRLISYLPAAHIADRGLSHYFAMIFGFEITSVADLADIAAAVREVRPTAFAAVPRVWEKFKAAIEAQLAASEPMRAAFDSGDAQIRAAIRTKLGLDEIRWVASGAAALAPKVHEFLIDLGLPVTELWGMSECGLATSCPAGDVRIGTVGRFLPGYEGRLDEDGELLVRGPGVMKGYRNDARATAEAIDEDGWLRTGDIASIDEDGFVRIVDRKKELIINAAGKNMSPANIQNAIVSGSPLIGAAMVVGDGRPYNVALIVLDPDAAAAFGAEHGLDPDPAVLVKDERVHAAVQAGVDAGNAALSRVEQVKRFTILPTFWPPGSDEITPTMKLRRRNIAEKYADDIDRLYSEDPR